MKRILAISLIISIAFVAYSINSLTPSIYARLGKDAYAQKNYGKASKLLGTALKFNHDNRDTRYYYIQSLINLPPTLAVQKAIFELSQENLPDSADLIADQQVSKWRNEISLNSGENYIEQVPFNDKILRWDVKKFPLNVKIENDADSKAPEYYQTQIQKAFLQWQASTDFIQFKFDESTPDILVKIVPAGKNKCDQESCKYVVAYTTPGLSGDLLKRMTITFYDSNNLGQPFGKREIYNTALHEIGHSLGIMGHSYNKGDLMYMENQENEVYDSVRSDFQSISPIDLNTLALLYKLIPDLTNTDLAHFDTSHQFFAPIVMGNEKQISSRKMLEAENYIKAAPNLPNGYIDLSAAYSEEKEYNSAIETLNKALELSVNDSEKFIVYYNLAIIYMNIQDWDNSLKYAEMAKQLQPQSSSEIDGLIAGIHFNKGNKSFAKQAYIDSLAKNPSKTIDALNLAKIYLKEYNFVQAGKTLNKLVQANPNVKNDPKIKPYGILMFLFR